MTIPDDIEAAALEAWMSVPTADWEQNAVAVIARAILAERQRCADAAENIGKSSMRSTRMFDKPEETARLIKNAILA